MDKLRLSCSCPLVYGLFHGLYRGCMPRIHLVHQLKYYSDHQLCHSSVHGSEPVQLSQHIDSDDCLGAIPSEYDLGQNEKGL